MLRKGLWLDPEFLKLWAGQTVSQLGSRISREGLPLTAVLVLGASPLQMGILSGVSGIAILLFGLIAGAWADRLRRRPILICTDLGRAAILSTIPLAAFLHKLTIGQLYATAALTGILNVFFDVSYQAYVPALVTRESILEGNSKVALTESIAEVAGPGLTGILVQILTAPIAILFDALSFLASAFSLWIIRRPEAPPVPNAAPHIVREISEGLRVTWRDPVLRAITLRTLTGSFFMGIISGLYILFAIRELRLSPALLGILISVGGVSSLFGAIFAERVVSRFGLGPTLIGAGMLAGVAAILPPLARGPVAACAAVLGLSQVFDLAWPLYTINELSLRQAIVPDHLLGRVNSAMHLLFRGILPAGALVGGVLAQITGVRAALFLGGLGSLASTLWLVFSPIPKIREFTDVKAANV
ncbi:MAG: MFS transporter [Bryobacteraceae bacterium]